MGGSEGLKGVFRDGIGRASEAAERVRDTVESKHNKVRYTAISCP